VTNQPRPPRGPGRRGLLAAAVALCVVLAATAVGAVVLLASDSEDNSSTAAERTGSGGPTISRKAKFPWWLPYTSSGQRLNLTTVRGMWFTDKEVVKAQPDGVFGYDKRSGQELWGVPVPGGADTVVCLASPDAGSGIALVAYGSGDTCDRLFAVDLEARKRLWDRGDLSSAENRVSETRIARTGDVVVFAAEDRTPAAFRVSDGAELWEDNPSLYDQGEGCTGSYTGGKTLVRLHHCTIEGDVAVTAVDPATGRSKWAYSLGTNRFTAIETQVLHTSPVILTTGGPDRLALHVLDDNGKLRSKPAAGPERLSPSSYEPDGSPSADVVVRGDTLVLTAVPSDLESNNNKILAWDINTGARLWEHTAKGHIDKYYLVDTDTDEALAYVSGNVYDPTKLLAFDRVTGEPTTVATIPAAGKSNQITKPLPYLRDGILYVSAAATPEVAGFDESSRASLAVFQVERQRP
jgi:outer membrane protein assembly factor BamB